MQIEIQNGTAGHSPGRVHPLQRAHVPLDGPDEGGEILLDLGIKSHSVEIVTKILAFGLALGCFPKVWESESNGNQFFFVIQWQKYKKKNQFLNPRESELT